MGKLSVVVLAVTLVACATAEADEKTTTTIASTTTSTTVQTTTTSQPTTTTSTSPTTTTTTAPTTSTNLPGFPPEATGVGHGVEKWGVYLAVSDDYADAELADATELARSYGYEFTGVADLGCDQGAAEALDLDPLASLATVAVFHDSEEDALQAVAAFEARGHSVIGMGLIQMYCLD